MLDFLAIELKPKMAQRRGIKSPEELRGSSTSDKKYFDYDRPPLFRLEDIFEDLTGNALSADLGKALRFLKDRPLRVATVCSGTESPLLAMNMVKKGEYQNIPQNIVPCLGYIQSSDRASCSPRVTSTRLGSRIRACLQL